VNKQSGVLYVCILALTLVLSGCAAAPTATPVPATLRAPTATTTATQVPTATPPPTAVPTAAPTQPPTATPTKAATAVPATLTAPAAPTAPANVTATCLACHGPYDKLMAATATYAGWSNGEVTSPHRYEPHLSKAAKDIPECTNCHRQHPVPPTASDIAALPKPDPSWCYGCHHMRVLQCGTCHPV
jgi:predicted CXXCH cytochrome family protein